MQNLTEKIFRLSPPGGIFDETVIRNVFSDKSEGARKLLVYRAVSAGEIIRLKPGLFLLAPEFRRTDPHPFVIAAALHSPSHVSLESALSHHGLIPEAVFQVASVTVFRSRTYETPVGVFVFERVPADDPKAGVRAIKVDGRSWAFVATPLRAIADLVYLRKRVRWERDGLAFLTESMRMETDDLRKMSFEDLEAVAASIHDRRTVAYLRGMHKDLTR